MINFLDHLLHEPINLWVTGLCSLIPLLIISLSRRNLNSPIVQFIPAFCTAIGIMFTFGVIYNTLGINEDLFKDNEISSLQKVVKTLSYKFSCSLIGVVFSIMWSLVIKSIISYRESKDKNDKAWLKKDPEEILWSLDQNFAEMIKEYRYNTEFISNAIFNSSDQSKVLLERLVNTVETFDREATENLKKTFDDLKNTLANSVEHLSQEAMKDLQLGISIVNKEFLETTQSMNAKNQEDFGNMLTASIDTLSKTLHKLDEIGNNIRGSMEQTSEGAAKGAKDVAKGFESSADSIKGSVSVLLESIQKQFEVIDNRFKNLDEQLQRSTQSVLDSNLEKLEKAFGVLAEIQTNSINRLEESTKQFNQSVHAYESVQDHQYGVLERVQHQIVLLKGLQETSEEQLKYWGEQASQMKDVRNGVVEITNTIDQLQQIKDSLAALAARN